MVKKQRPVEEEIDEILEEEEEEDEELEEDEREETPYETVRRILQEGESEDDLGDEDAEGEEGDSEDAEDEELVDDEEPRSPGRPKEPDVDPPARFTAEEKEVFSKAPKKIQRALDKMVKDHQAQFTRAQMQYAEAEKQHKAMAQDAQHVLEVVRPYLKSKPDLLENYTEGKLVAALIAAHERLSNPQTAKQAWLNIGAEIGIDAETLQDLSQGATTQAPSVAADPQFQALHKELNDIKSWREQILKHQEQGVVQKAVSDIDAVAEEKDANGQYIYPEMHNPSFWEEARPLVSAYTRPPFNLDYAQAVKRSYNELVGPVNNGPGIVNQTEPSANIQRARAAAVSVRGQSAPVESDIIDDIPAEALADPYKTAAWLDKHSRR